MPELSTLIVNVLAGLVGAALTFIPKFIGVTRNEGREDWKSILEEQRKLLRDIKLERTAIKEELVEAKAAHLDCLEKSRIQQNEIDRLIAHNEDQDKKIRNLEREVRVLKGKSHT